MTLCRRRRKRRMVKKRSRIPGGSGKTLESVFEEKRASFRAEQRSHSLKDDVVYYTPNFSVEGKKESYWLHSTQAGLFQCKVTGLVFNMKSKGDVTYMTVSWKQRDLAQLGKRPAGPLFDLECPQRSLCQLHLPHCEILSSGGGKSLSVGHVMDENPELIDPHEITETHVIINVTGCSAYGVVEDVNSPNPKRALVALFYTPTIDDNEPISILKVLLLPDNIVLIEVRNKRRELNGEEIYIEKPTCKLILNKEYTLSTSPQDDAIIIRPNRAPFEIYETYDNYITTFEVTLMERFKHVRLRLRDSNTSDCAWDHSVYLSPHDIRKKQIQRTSILTADNKLFSVRCKFIESVSDPVLDKLLDKLLDERVLNDDEREKAVSLTRKLKASFVIDTVKRKGPDASSHMISFLCEMDPYLTDNLGLKTTTQQNGPEHPQPRSSGRQPKGRPDRSSKERTQPRMETRKRKFPS